MMLATTTEPAVTADTRFWLFTELGSSWWTHDREPRHGEPFRIKYEVSEAAYRAAYAEAVGQGSDVTLPLDDHWWNDLPVPPFSAWPFGHSLRRTHGGYIDWWG